MHAGSSWSAPRRACARTRRRRHADGSTHCCGWAGTARPSSGPDSCVVSERAGQWLKQDGFAHMSTAGGAELGCIVALKVLEITQRPEVVSMVRYISDFIRAGLDEIKALYPDFFTGIRQNGVIMGLEFNDPEGAKPVMKHLYENGVWAIFSTLDPSVLQFKPGILMTQELSEDLLRRVEVSIGRARAEVMGPRGRSKVA